MKLTFLVEIQSSVQKNNLQVSKQLRAEVCWMQDTNLIPGAKYWLQLGIQKVQIKIKSINHRLELEKPQNRTHKHPWIE